MNNLVISDKIYCRYEANIDNGKLIIYFKESNDLYELPYPYYAYLRLLQKGCLQDVYQLFERANYTNMPILNDFHSIEQNLLNLGIIQYACE